MRYERDDEAPWPDALDGDCHDAFCPPDRACRDYSSILPAVCFQHALHVRSLYGPLYCGDRCFTETGKAAAGPCNVINTFFDPGSVVELFPLPGFMPPLFPLEGRMNSTRQKRKGNTFGPTHWRKKRVFITVFPKSDSFSVVLTGILAGPVVPSPHRRHNDCRN